MFVLLMSLWSVKDYYSGEKKCWLSMYSFISKYITNGPVDMIQYLKTAEKNTWNKKKIIVNKWMKK